MPIKEYIIVKDGKEILKCYTEADANMYAEMFNAEIKVRDIAPCQS